jgi:response regulator NasT
MRVLVVDPDSARAALVAQGLSGVEPLEVRHAAVFLEADVEAFAPDIVVVASDVPDRATIERLRKASLTTPRPVVMFVDRSEPGLAEAAVAAGVAAYVVDGLAPSRVQAVLEVAMSRFALMNRLQLDLDKAKADLAARRTVERAKALLMKERGLEEAQAHGLLRKLSMDAGRPMGAVAADLLTFAEVLKRDMS